MTSTHTVGSNPLKDAYQRLNDRVAAAAERSGRRREEISVVAVTKHASPDQIRQLVEMGHCDLGENRVQQLTQRAAQLDEYLSRRRSLGRGADKEQPEVPEAVRWHMVGHLQRNKVKHLLPLVQLIHSVDSLRLAEEVHAHAQRLDGTADVLLQVNASKEPGKHGIAAPAVLHLAEQIDTMLHLRLRGLMAMPPQTDSEEAIRWSFSRAREIFQDIRDAKIGGAHFNALSMGMTNDFEIAIEQGANIIRVGRALFGES